MVKIKTKIDPCLKITVKKTADFKKLYDEFTEVLLKRKEERDRLKAEKQAEAEAKKAEESASAAAAEGDDAKPADSSAPTPDE